MTQDALHPLAEDYLRRLRRAARGLPRDRREELIAEITGHLVEAVPPDASDHEARGVLARLGSPEEIVEAERPSGSGRGDRRTWREWAAVTLLPLGGFAVGIGWLVGLVLLWSSRLWTTRDKVIGTLIVPGGIATALVVLFLIGTKRKCTQLTTTGSATGAGITQLRHCTPSAGQGAATTVWHIVVVAFFVLAPLASAVYLARRARATSSFVAGGP
jgi:hypothetical protein